MKNIFHSRFGLIVALLGMAVGTGNIWRFPRVMSQNGGGAFLIPWFLFLFLWSIPLLTVEFSCGKKIRRSLITAFARISDGRFAWLGAFVTFCTLAIMFYYSVVTGWCLYYFYSSLTGASIAADTEMFWRSFSQSGSGPLFYHFVALSLCAVVLWQGINRGIEKISRIFIPLLFIIMIILAAYALTLPGRNQGLGFIFNTDFTRLTDYKVWLHALTQSAWSTGAGWGLAYTYACYAHEDDPELLTPATTAFGNNSMELIAVMAIVLTLFSFMPLDEVLALAASGNAGLTFIALPKLFGAIPLGNIVAILFFGSLLCAAFTSLIAMAELGVAFLSDFGMRRNHAIVIVVLCAFLIGAPSAWRTAFLDNQDWVWGMGLLISGFIFTLLVRMIGADTFFNEYLGKIPRGYKMFLKGTILWIIPLEFLALIGWWFHQAKTWDESGWLNPFNTFSVGTCLAQWGILIVFLLAMNAVFHKLLRARNDIR